MIKTTPAATYGGAIIVITAAMLLCRRRLCRRNFLHLKQAVAAGKVKSATIRGRQADPLQLTFVDDLHVAAGGVMAATAMVWSAHPGETDCSNLHATSKGCIKAVAQYRQPQQIE